ncbi:MAG: hypothetical protein QOJ34_3354, partial [Pseudonocardiales bacterium]|nr:hypothetical protein [Pseudonocardiales bacterium]
PRGPPAPPPDVAATVRDVVVGDMDAGQMSVRVYAPEDSPGPLPCLFWVYGGGYIFEPIHVVDPRLLQWAADFQCVVVAPSYRLAPEHPFPAAHDDCRTAIGWMLSSAEELGIDRARLVIGGESAGGGLAAGIVLRMRDEGEMPFIRQLLVYAALDDRHVTPSSQAAGALIWSSELSRFAWDCYLGGVDEISPYAAPARAADLRGLPPTFIAVGANDITRDENIAFAERLTAALTSVDLHVYDGAPHAFELLAPDAAVSRRMSRDLDRAVGRSVGADVGVPDQSQPM